MDGMFVMLLKNKDFELLLKNYRALIICKSEDSYVKEIIKQNRAAIKEVLKKAGIVEVFVYISDIENKIEQQQDDESKYFLKTVLKAVESLGDELKLGELDFIEIIRNQSISLAKRRELSAKIINAGSFSKAMVERANAFVLRTEEVEISATKAEVNKDAAVAVSSSEISDETNSHSASTRSSSASASDNDHSSESENENVAEVTSTADVAVSSSKVFSSNMYGPAPMPEVIEVGMLHNAGDIAATLKLALCYYHGHGIEVDKKEAFKLFFEAHNNKCAKSTAALACCYRDGSGVEKDLEKAESLFQEARSKGVENPETFFDQPQMYGSFPTSQDAITEEEAPVIQERSEELDEQKPQEQRSGKRSQRAVSMYIEPKEMQRMLAAQGVAVVAAMATMRRSGASSSLRSVGAGAAAASTDDLSGADRVNLGLARSSATLKR